METGDDEKTLDNIAREAKLSTRGIAHEADVEVQMIAVEQVFRGEQLESEWLRALPDPEGLHDRFRNAKNTRGMPVGLEDAVMQKRVEKRITTPGPEFLTLSLMRRLRR